MKTEIESITPEFLFLKYKGVLAPWEIIAQAKRFGFKCKKYVNWTDVHATERSREVLKQVGDSLIDTLVFDISEFDEISLIWERVHRWTKDKEGFSVEPDVLPEYEKILRLTDVGAKKPDVVDLMIGEFGFDEESLSINDRWIVYIAICTYNFFQTSKRYQSLVDWDEGINIRQISWKIFVSTVRSAVERLYSKLGYDVSTMDDTEVLSLFLKELGCVDSPMLTKRSAEPKSKTIPKVWIDKYDGGKLELVKFQYSDGNVIVKLNKTNKIHQSSSSISKLLIDEEFWDLIGHTLLSHVNHIDEIQDFFDTLAKQIRLRG